MNNGKRNWKRVGLILLGSVGFNAYLVFFGGDSLLVEARPQ